MNRSLTKASRIFASPDALGLLAIIGYLLFLPVPTRPDLSIFLLLALGIPAFLSSEGLRPSLVRLDFMVLSVFIAAACVAAIFSEEPSRSGRYLVYLLTNVFLLILAASLRNKRAVLAICGCLAFLGFLHLFTIISVGSLPGFATPEAIIDRQPFTTLLVPNDALIIGLCLPALGVLAYQCRRRWSTSALLLVTTYLLLGAYAAYLLQSKTIIVSLVAAQLAVVIAWRTDSTYPMTVKRIVAGGFLLMVSLSIMLFVAWYVGNQSTTRLGLWSHAITKISGVRMLFGTGPNTFSYDPNLVETAFEEGDLVIPWVHNLFLEAYTEQGVIGLIGLLAMTIVPLVRGIRIREPAFRAMVCASALTFLALGLVEITLTRRFNFAYLALIYGLACAPALRKQS